MNPLMLETVSIDGFRGLRNLSLQGLGRVNVLVGENNSGKTSVLEALSVLANPLDPMEWLALVRRRDFGGLDETRIQSLRWCFRQSGQLMDPEAVFEGRCEMRSTGEFALRTFRVTYRDLLGEPIEPSSLSMSNGGRRSYAVDVGQPRRGAEIEHDVEFEGGGAAEIAVEIWEDERTTIRPRRGSDRLRTETLTPYSYQVNRMQVRYYSETRLRNREAALALIRLFDPDIEAIEIASFRGARPALYLMHRTLGPAPLSVFGDALRRVVLLATTMNSLRKGLLLLDEIETGIHVSALSRVFAWLMEAAERVGVQVVATTHSLEAVDALLAGAGEPPTSLVAFHLDQTPDATRARRFDRELLSRLRRERGLDVR